MKGMELFDKDGRQLDVMDVLRMKPRVELNGVIRVEVIDKSGRAYVNWKENNKVEVLVQDEGRTLKVVIKE
jgi:hypothetical protein